MVVKSSPILYELEQDCCACFACQNICTKNAISFVPNSIGFIFPVIDSEKCINCGLCETVCDFKKGINNGVYTTIPNQSYAVKNKNKEVLAKSSSGGMFSAIAEYVISQKGVVYGCVMDDRFNVYHTQTDNVNGLDPMRGSKYVQSNVGLIYRDVKKVLKEGRIVLFTGTPCQVAALYSYLGTKHSYKNLFTMDFICHGVPSNDFFKQYIACLENKENAKILNFKFRDKAMGWGKIIYKVVYARGIRKFTKRYGYRNSEFYPIFYSQGNLSRESCFNCKYATNLRVSDITVGDFWGYEKVKLDFDSSDGISVCLLNTEKAMDIFKHLQLYTNKLSLKVATEYNHSFNTPTVKGEEWYNVMSAFKRGKLGALNNTLSLRQKVMGIIDIHIPIRIIKKIKHILGK